MQQQTCTHTVLVWLHVLMAMTLLPFYTAAERPSHAEKLCDQAYNLTDVDTSFTLSYDSAHLLHIKCRVTVRNAARALTSLCVQSDSRKFYPDCGTKIVVTSNSGIKKEFTCSSREPPDMCTPEQTVYVSFERTKKTAIIKPGFVELVVFASNDIDVIIPGTLLIGLLGAGAGIVVVAAAVAVSWLSCCRRNKDKPCAQGLMQVQANQETVYTEIPTALRDVQCSEKNDKLL